MQIEVGPSSDNIHLNARGSTIVGELIASAIARLLGASGDVPTSDHQFDISTMLQMCRSAPGAGEPFKPGVARKVLASTGRYPSFSPDGRFMLFQNLQAGRERIEALDWQSRKIIDLTPDTTSDTERHPAFLNYRGGEFEIVFGASSGINGAVERLMVRHWPSMETRPLLAGSLGGAIAAVKDGQVFFPGFGSQESDRVPDLYKYDMATEVILRLTDTPWEEWRPAVAADGTIFFIANPEGNFDLYELPVGSSHPKILFRSLADEWDPAISPDARWVAFASRRYGNWGLFLIDRKNSEAVTRLTDFQSDEWDPAFHPTGRLLIFAASSGRAPHVYGMCLFGEK